MVVECISCHTLVSVVLQAVRVVCSASSSLNMVQQVSKRSQIFITMEASDKGQWLRQMAEMVQVL